MDALAQNDDPRLDHGLEVYYSFLSLTVLVEPGELLACLFLIKYNEVHRS